MAYEINNDNTDKSGREEESDLDTLYGKTDLTKKQKISNFLYYYKTAIIISIIVLAVVVFLVIQTVTRTDPDLYFLYSGRYYIDADSYRNIQVAFQDLINKDYNSDGKVYFEIITKTIKFPEPANTEGQDSSTYLNGSDVLDGMSSFRTEIMAGSSVICLVDEQLYESLASEGRLETLSTVLGKAPENAIDDYGILLKDTPFAQACPELKKLSDKTVVCIKKKTVAMSEKTYEYHLDAFRILFECNNAEQ